MEYWNIEALVSFTFSITPNIQYANLRILVTASPLYG